MKYFEGHPHPTLHPCCLCVTVTILASALIWEKEVRIDEQKYQNFDILFWVDEEIFLMLYRLRLTNSRYLLFECLIMLFLEF